AAGRREPGCPRRRRASSLLSSYPKPRASVRSLRRYKVRAPMAPRSFVRASSAALVLALAALVVPRDAAAGGWKKIDESDGILVYRREVPGSDVVALKGEGVVAAPLTRVASALFDTARATEWVEDLVEARVLRRFSDMEYVEYDRFAMPLIVTDRDF